MRFLCLHGRGTNSDIFESQLGNLISRLPSEHTFDFVDAPIDCAAAPGVAQFYPPPYLCWHDQYSTKEIRAGLDCLRLIMEEDGPYDGIIGFSQGAALAASLLLSQDDSPQRVAGTSDEASPVVRVAIFFSSVNPFSPSKHLGCGIIPQVAREAEKHGPFSWGKAISSTGATMEGENHNPVPTIYAFHPDHFLDRIRIPTLHVIGTEDVFSEHAQVLVGLCEPHQAEVLLWRGGHEIPREKRTLDQCVELFEQIVNMAAF